MPEILDLLYKVGAVYTAQTHSQRFPSHFVLTSGRHSDTYIDKARLLMYPRIALEVGRRLAAFGLAKHIQAIVGPAYGGITLSAYTALGCVDLNPGVISAFTEHDKDMGQKLKRFAQIIEGKRVRVVEDLTTTGKSAKIAVQAVWDVGGIVEDVAVMVNRGPDEVTDELFGVPFYALGVVRFESFSSDDCPLCRRDVEINTVLGHGQQFLMDRQA